MSALGQKQTYAVQNGMSVIGQKRTHAAQQKGSLFDHLAARSGSAGGIVNPITLAAFRLVRTWPASEPAVRPASLAPGSRIGKLIGADWFLLWHPWSVTTYIRCGPFVTLAMTRSLQLREHWGCGRAKNADALEKSRHHARDQFFGAVFHDLGRGAGKLGAGKDCRTTLRGQLSRPAARGR